MHGIKMRDNEGMEDSPAKSREGRGTAANVADKSQAKSFAQDAAEKVGIGKSHSLFTLILVSVGASAIVATYVLVVGSFSIHRIETDTMGDAALIAAQELSDIKVEHPSVGALCLNDWRQSHLSEGERHPPRSLASVKQTLAKIEQVATLTGVQAFKKLAGRDQEIVNDLENRLFVSLQDQIAGSLDSNPEANKRNQEEHGRIYEHVQTLLASHLSPTETALTELNIRLGLIDDKKDFANALPPLAVPQRPSKR